MTVTERFRRVADGQILYSFEINDPKVFCADPGQIAMNATDGPLFEAACTKATTRFSLAGGRRAAKPAGNNIGRLAFCSRSFCRWR